MGYQNGYFSGTVFDLNPLKILRGAPWKVEDGENHLYEFNICGPVTGTTCNSTSGLIGEQFQCISTLKATITTTADDILIFFVVVF